MCITWKIRQSRNGIDDFGHPLEEPTVQVSVHRYGAEEEVPGLVIGDEDPIAVTEALASALETAVEEDVRSHGVRMAHEIPMSEETPLLRPGKTRSKWWPGGKRT
jgi:hypothetical protein